MTSQASEDPSLSGDILFVGGGITGTTAAIEAAETGKKVILIEKNPYLGGRVTQMNRYFPKLCPPSCGLEINFRRIRQNPAIHIMTLSEVEAVSGNTGDFLVTIRRNPRYVNDLCTACGKCVEPCPANRSNDFNFGLDTTKAIYLPHETAFPLQYVLDKEACRGNGCRACIDACPYDAIDLAMEPETLTAAVKSIVWATGWKPYDPSHLDIFGYGRCQNVITSVVMERLAALNGPTGGRILRPSDKTEAKRIAFVQCAGSRDENHLPYCSAVCCLASMKHATYIREQYPDSEVSIYYIDVRAPGRLEDFYTRMQEDEHVHFHRGKVADVKEDPATHDLLIRAEDTLTGRVAEETVDLVVLAIGIVPNSKDDFVPSGLRRDDFGFIIQNDNGGGMYGAGTAVRPMDVSTSIRDGMSAALNALCADNED